MTAYAIPCDLVVPIFNPGDRSKTPASQLTEQMMRDYSGGKPPVFRSLVHMDDPDHSAYRKVTSAQLLPTAIAPLEDLIREIARSYIGKMLSGGPTIDFASEIAMHYPLKVVCTLMGLSKPDHKTMLRLTQRFLSYAGSDLCRPGSKLLDPEHMIRTWQIVYDEFCDRSAAQDYTLSGRPIKAGDLLYVSYFSASRDDTAFEDPYDFRIDRRMNRHMSLGYGPHVCLGQHLARLEMRACWEELLPRLDAVTMTGDGQWQHSEFACGPKSVPIRYSMR